MDLLLAWYLLCSVGFVTAVWFNTHEQKSVTVRHKLPQWVSDLVAYTEPIEGYRDPIFEPEDHAASHSKAR